MWIQDLIRLASDNPSALILLCAVLLLFTLALTALIVYKALPTVIERYLSSPEHETKMGETDVVTPYSDMRAAIAGERSELNKLAEAVSTHENRISLLESTVRHLEPLKEDLGDLRVAAEAIRCAAEAGKERLGDFCDRLARIEDRLIGGDGYAERGRG